MLWMVAYGIPAIGVGVVCLTQIDRTPGRGAVQAHRTLAALAAGLLWPVLAAGAAQFGVLILIRKTWRALRPVATTAEDPARPGPRRAAIPRQTVGV